MENKCYLFRETESVRWRVPALPMLWLHSLKMGCTSACLFSKFIFNGKEVQLLSLLGSLDCVNQLRQNVHTVFLSFFFFFEHKKKEDVMRTSNYCKLVWQYTRGTVWGPKTVDNTQETALYRWVYAVRCKVNKQCCALCLRGEHERLNCASL